ncbi:MarR family transcriptional regulator [uncultured Olleya sp.]|uniref:MarR family winged helix-turn-helix transcriptional regulator n=1 Tax=uncultured Olleya sp. TaxID=757243 RepID=UPI002597FA6F|nr:MarR family transcriptional regulator [uncultured Olleya sp.]
MSTSCEYLKLDNQLCFPLYAASRLTTKIYSPHLKVLDITYPQYLVMLVLWEHKTMSVNAIGSLLFLESNTLTPLLKRLEQKQLIKRTRSTEDERTVLITLKDKGEKLKTKAEQIPLKIKDTFKTNEFSEDELISFQSNLIKLLNSIQKQINNK